MKLIIDNILTTWKSKSKEWISKSKLKSDINFISFIKSIYKLTESFDKTELFTSTNINTTIGNMP